MAQFQHQQSQNFPLVLDALYCEEEQWQEREDDYVGEDELGEESYYVDPSQNAKSPFSPSFWGEEDEELASLLSKEKETANNLLYSALETDPSLAETRREVVDWVLKVNAHYSFSALTAVLAVNYFDRFLLSFQFQKEKPWMTHLAAVACLSLAAKVEETHVPLLLDLQVEETSYVFEAKTIQRMEILVLSTLQWRMNPVTPLDFLNHMTTRLGLKNHLCRPFLRTCECLIFFIISDYRFMGHLPSVIATATMLHVIGGTEPCFAAEYEALGIDKDKVEECRKLILESASRGCFGHQSGKRKVRSILGSPNGVMDVSFSSDSSNDSWAAAVSVSSSPEPPLKKGRAEECNASAEFFRFSPF